MREAQDHMVLGLSCCRGPDHGCRAEWAPEGSAQARINGSTAAGNGSWPRCSPEGYEGSGSVIRILVPSGSTAHVPSGVFSNVGLIGSIGSGGEPASAAATSENRST